MNAVTPVQPDLIALSESDRTARSDAIAAIQHDAIALLFDKKERNWGGHAKGLRACEKFLELIGTSQMSIEEGVTYVRGPDSKAKRLRFSDDLDRQRTADLERADARFETLSREAQEGRDQILEALLTQIATNQATAAKNEAAAKKNETAAHSIQEAAAEVAKAVRELARVSGEVAALNAKNTPRRNLYNNIAGSVIATCLCLVATVGLHYGRSVISDFKIAGTEVGTPSPKVSKPNHATLYGTNIHTGLSLPLPILPTNLPPKSSNSNPSFNY